MKTQEERPLILERLGRPKYYIIYPKPPLLDNQWESRGINVVKQAKILTFSKLDDLGTPLGLSESLFYDTLVDMVID